MAAPLRSDPIALGVDNWVAAGWRSSSLGMAAVTSVMRAQQLLLHRADELLRPLGLTFARFEVLMLLRFSKRGELPPGKIGQRLQVHAASVSSALNRLEADGMVVRRSNPRDGRGVLASITPAGRESADRGAALLNTELFETLPLPDDDLEMLVDVIGRLRLHFGDWASPESST